MVLKSSRKRCEVSVELFCVFPALNFTFRNLIPFGFILPIGELLSKCQIFSALLLFNQPWTAFRIKVEIYNAVNSCAKTTSYEVSGNNSQHLSAASRKVCLEQLLNISRLKQIEWLIIAPGRITPSSFIKTELLLINIAPVSVNNLCLWILLMKAYVLRIMLPETLVLYLTSRYL